MNSIIVAVLGSGRQIEFRYQRRKHHRGFQQTDSGSQRADAADHGAFLICCQPWFFKLAAENIWRKRHVRVTGRSDRIHSHSDRHPGPSVYTVIDSTAFQGTNNSDLCLDDHCKSCPGNENIRHTALHRVDGVGVCEFSFHVADAPHINGKPRCRTQIYGSCRRDVFLHRWNRRFHWSVFDGDFGGCNRKLYGRDDIFGYPLHRDCHHDLFYQSWKVKVEPDTKAQKNIWKVNFCQKEINLLAWKNISNNTIVSIF